MQAIESGWSRFYGLPVPQDVAATATEHMIDTTVDDLVDAHLGINYAYFGGIDKTLSGFVLLDDEGDDYTLLDLRDTGQVWFQDHETRDVSLKNDKEKPKPTKRVISTVDLCARYQWLVWQLAMPLMKNGKPMQTIDYLVRNGIGRFRHVFPRKEAFEKTFAAELPHLIGDPHLAIYWLLHTTALAEDARRAEVLAAIGDSGPELLQAFVARLGSLPVTGDLPVIPEFRARRSLATIYGPFDLADEETYSASLRALELSPATRSLQMGLQIAAGIDRGKLEVPAVEAVFERIPEATTGTELVRALLEKRRGATSSKHADEFAKLAATSDDPWWSTLEGLWQVHELAYDGAALVAVTRNLVPHDRYHRRSLQMAMRAAQIAGQPFEHIEDDMEVAEGVLGPYTRLVELPDQWKQVIESIIDPAILRALAWRILQRVELNKPSPELAAWAAGQVLAAEGGAELVGGAFAKLDPVTQTAVIEAAGKVIDRGDHPLVDVVLASLDGPEPAENDFAAQFQLKRGKEAALVTLAPWFPTPHVFEAVMKLLARPAGGDLVSAIYGKLFSPFEKASYVLPKLDDKQAVRVAKAMIATKLKHPSIHARNAAGHQLYRFDHRGAETFLIDALTDYGVQYAASKSKDDNLEDLVANLYAALRNLQTPAAKTALVERLFAERRSYWRMGSAVGDIFSPEVHQQVLALMRERRDARAAGCYAYALHDFVKQGAPLVELTREILDWQGDNEQTRGFLHYALIVGMIAALDARDYDLVRRAHDAASWISDPPLEPDDFSRGNTWTNPLDEPSVKARLDHVLSGKAEEAKKKLIEAAHAARAAGKPTLRITDEAVGELADTTVLDRVLHDSKTGEVWFRDREKRLRYFDGYSVAEGGFTARSVGNEGVGADLDDATAVSGRTLWWDKKGESFRDVLRLGRHVLLSWGVNNGTLERYLLSFDDADGAAGFATKLRANPPKGMTESEPYYFAGKGAIVRTYYAPKPGGADREKRLLWLLGTAVSDEDQGSEERAVGEHLSREAAWLRGGGVMSGLEWSEGRRRDEDKTVREWMQGRIRDDRRDPRWHLAALTQIGDYLVAHRLAPKGFVVELAPPATADEIAAYAASRSHPLPEPLRALWAVHGGARWHLDGKHAMRFLSPYEVEARRPVARAAGDDYLEKLPPDVAARSAPLFAALDILVENLDGTPVTFIADVVRDDGRVFSHAADHPNDFWWEVSLSWMLATRFLAAFDEAIAAAVPAVEKLKYGEHPAKAPAMTKPAPARPAARKPAARKPAAKKPAARKPAAKKPAARKPAAKKPAAKKPAAKASKPGKKLKPAPRPTAKPAAKTKPKPNKRR